MPYKQPQTFEEKKSSQIQNLNCINNAVALLAKFGSYESIPWDAVAKVARTINSLLTNGFNKKSIELIEKLDKLEEGGLMKGEDLPTPIPPEGEPF